MCHDMSKQLRRLTFCLERTQVCVYTGHNCYICLSEQVHDDVIDGIYKPMNGILIVFKEQKLGKENAF